MTTDSYKNWQIRVKKEQNLCAKYSFYITDPKGNSQHVKMGGDNEQRAMERAREMIDMEISIEGDD